MDDIKRTAKRAHENRIEAILRQRTADLPVLDKPVQSPAAGKPAPREGGEEGSSYVRIVFLVIGLAVIASAAFTGYKTYKTYEARKAAQGPAADDTIEKVGKLVELPQGETPTVATISDLKQLEGQPFFAGAAVGDKVVIYKEAKIAILYRPSTNKVIRDAPLNQ